MNILFVSSGNNAGYYQGDISPQVKSVGESLGKVGINVTYYLIKGKGIYGYLKGCYKLHRFLKQNGKNYELIHAHNGLCGIIAWLADFHKHKIVISYLGSDIIGFVDENGNYSYIGKIFLIIYRLLSKYIFDFNIVKSQEMLRYLRCTERAEVIPNGVDFNIFYPIDQQAARKQLKLSSEKLIAVFVANPCEGRKNFKLAQQSVRLLKNKVLLIPVYGKSQQELNLYYNSANVMLLTSFHEGSPNVIKEAMACNCPIVSTDVGDVRSIIGRTKGCYIADFDPYDFAQKIEFAILFGRRTKGREDIAYLQDEQVANKLKSIYLSLIER